MIFSIAWKNIWRNKVRSLVVLMAISIGLLGGIVAVALMNGLLTGRLNDAIKIEVSSLQLHNAGFMANSEIRYIIPEADTIIDFIEKYPGVEAVSKRFKSEVMISSNRSAAGVVLIAVEPEKEKKVSQLYKHFIDSSSQYLEGAKRNPIIIGKKLADKLKVHLRSKVMINGVDINGEAVQPVFRVTGIFRTQNSGFDEMNVFIKYDDAARIFGLKKGDAHEIAVLMKEILNSSELAMELKKRYTRYKIDDNALLRIRNDSVPQRIYNGIAELKSDDEYSYDRFNEILNSNFGEEVIGTYGEQIRAACETGIDVEEWRTLSPELAMQSTWLDFMLYLFVGIILLALGFGIVNTMLMVVLERVRELGMLIAIGMNRRRVFLMIMLETVLLSFTGGIAGILMSWGVVAILHSHGVNLSSIGEGLQAIGYPTIVYPEIGLASYFQVAVMVVLTGIFASVYPAWHAVRLNPAEAIRSD